MEEHSSHDRQRGRAWAALGLLCAAWPVAAQQTDSTEAVPLAPVTVAVTRADADLARTPWAVHAVAPGDMARGRPAWGLDEVLAAVPGVMVANRHNFSVDQRLAIRGFGARSAFAVRGTRLVLDGIPLSLPDGQGQLTAVNLGAVERIEVLRGAASALYGNAAGGVVSITSAAPVAATPAGRARVLAGAFDREWRRAWTKWQADGRVGLGDGYAWLSASRLTYEGERDHTAADLRTASARVVVPVGGWTLSILADGGDAPRADNPGALTAAELAANPDSAAALNLLRRAGKAVTQAQGGVSLRGRVAGTELTVGAFGITRDLENPLPQAFIALDRASWGLRASARRAGRVGWTAGLDAQWQRDDRRERAYLVPNAALTTPDARTDTLTRSQLERVAELGPFAQVTLDLSTSVTATAGVRHDAVRFTVRDRFVGDGVDNSGARTYAATSGSVGVVVRAARAVTLYGNLSTAFETPTTTELNNQPPPAGGGFNLSLEPQRAVSLEVGARGASRRVTWSAAAFTVDVRDELIAFEDTLVPGRRYFRNAARARHRGVELGASARATAGVTLEAAWTWSDFRYRAYRLGAAVLDGRAIPGIPRHWIRAGLRAGPGRAGGPWGGLDVSHASSALVDDTLAARAKRWTQVDVRLGWEAAVRGATLAPVLGINNVFNRRYVSSVVINAARGRYYEPAPGRNAFVGFEVAASRRAGAGSRQPAR